MHLIIVDKYALHIKNECPSQDGLGIDFLVNVPKVGKLSVTRMTCALKNLFGLVPQKRKAYIYHLGGMHKVIADISQIVKPDLNIVDAGSKVILGMDALAVMSWLADS